MATQDSFVIGNRKNIVVVNLFGICKALLNFIEQVQINQMTLSLYDFLSSTHGLYIVYKVT